MKKKNQWQVIHNANPQLSPPRGQLQLVVNNAPGALLNPIPDFSDSIPLWTKTPLKSILKEIKTATHPAALNALQKLTSNHPKKLEIMMALYDARLLLKKEA